MKFTDISEAYSWLDSIPKFQDRGTDAANFDVQHFVDFCDEIGNPQENFKSIHVAGTNGKGSVCRILAHLYQKEGYSTALYTSPHLLEYNERFRKNGATIPDEDILRFLNRHKDVIKEYELTYFEISTALAFWWFDDQAIDLAIIETGLGGRLDATNIINPLLSIITTVALDHTDILGDTIPDIAREKGGIIKTKIPVLSGVTDPVAREVLKKIAESRQSPWYSLDSISSKFITWKQVWSAISQKLTHRSIFFRRNVQMALAAQYILKQQLPVSFNHLQVSQAEILTDLVLPGVFERLDPDLPWYFDGGHNVEAVRALKQQVNKKGSVDNSVLILALMKDKVNIEVMGEFSDFKKIYYYPLKSERAATIEHIQQHVPNAQQLPTDQSELESLLEELKSELVIFGGSFYLYSTVEQWLALVKRPT